MISSRSTVIAAVLAALNCGGTTVSALPTPTKTLSADGECDLSKPFGDHVTVSLGTDLPAHFPTLSPDELTIYFAQTLIDGARSATRSTRDRAFTVPQRLEGLPSDGIFGKPRISPDGRTLYFVEHLRLADDTGDIGRLGFATRPTATGAFTEVHNTVPGLERDDVNMFYISDDGASIYYTYTRPEANQPRVLKRSWDGNAWGEPEFAFVATNLGNVGRNLQPLLSSDLSTMYLSGGEPLVLVGVRPKNDAPFAPFTKVDALAYLTVTWVSPNGCRVYGSTGSGRIYVSERGL